MSADHKRLLVIGAHPDDAEFHVGGLMLKWVAQGHEVMILSLTNGAAGHHHLNPTTLAAVRQKEAVASAALLDAHLQVWDTADGTLQPTLALRHKLISEIRSYAPDLIITHRPADYHPDHRATAQLVQDACYLLQVPNIVPKVAPMASIPPVLWAADSFTYPRPFRADWVIDITSVLAGVIELLHCHTTQVYEWLPHTQGISVPKVNRRAWLRDWYQQRPMKLARLYADDGIAFAEAFEVSEYGGRFNANEYSLDSIANA